MWLDRTDTATARKRAAGLIAASKGLRVFSGTPDKPLGISVGVAVFDAGGDAKAVAAPMARADAAMYEIKHGGKSGYVIAAAAEPAEMSDETTAADEASEADRQATA
jgi:GGDEF domain-containing protein